MARILVVDDDQAVRATISAMLQAHGHEVATAIDGDDGIEHERRAPCDLVLCDIFMPGRSGITTLRSLREIDDKLPIVIMTGGAPSRWRDGRAEFIDYLELARRYGATAAITKRFNAAELVAVAARALQATSKS